MSRKGSLEVCLYCVAMEESCFGDDFKSGYCLPWDINRMLFWTGSFGTCGEAAQLPLWARQDVIQSEEKLCIDWELGYSQEPRSQLYYTHWMSGRRRLTALVFLPHRLTKYAVRGCDVEICSRLSDSATPLLSWWRSKLMEFISCVREGRSDISKCSAKPRIESHIPHRYILVCESVGGSNGCKFNVKNCLLCSKIEHERK